jgi:AcrR family transcriptional regulator
MKRGSAAKQPQKSRALNHHPPSADSAPRQQIVQAARAHFFNHGFRSVTMDDLATELAVSKKTLYAHFPSKTALLEAVLNDKFARVSTALERATSQGQDEFSTNLHALLAAAQRELDEIKPPFVRDMRLKAPHVFETIERRRAELIQRHFGKLFVDGQRAGKVRKDIPARLIIEILLGAVQAIMNPQKVGQLALQPKSAFVGIVKIVLEGALVRKGTK